MREIGNWDTDGTSYGVPARRVPASHTNFHIYRFINVADGFEYISSGGEDRPAIVPAGRYYVTLNDSYVIRNVAAGERVDVQAGRIEIPGGGLFDIKPSPDVRRFTWLGDNRNCSRDGIEANILMSCAIPRPGVFDRGQGVTVLPGEYEVSIYDAMGALLQVQQRFIEE